MRLLMHIARPTRLAKRMVEPRCRKQSAPRVAANWDRKPTIRGDRGAILGRSALINAKLWAFVVAKFVLVPLACVALKGFRSIEWC